MWRANLCITTACFSALLAPSRAAHAQDGATLVAIVTAEPNASLTRRVRAELAGLGVDVIVLKPPDEASPSRAPLERAARSVGAIAAVRLVLSGEGRIEVWVADRVTGKAVVRELDAPAGGASDAAVAVAAVELLRASLMELHSGEPSRGEQPASEQVRALALPSSRATTPARLGLGVGAGPELGFRGLGVSGDVDVGVWVRIAPHVGARLLGRASVLPAHVSTPSGAVDVSSQLVGAMATYAVVETPSAWEPTAGIGIAAAHVAATGVASPPLVGASESTWVAGPLADLGVAWSFAPGLHLRADGVGVWTIPPVRVRTPSGDAGWWGGPTVCLSLGFEVLWAP